MASSDPGEGNGMTTYIWSQLVDEQDIAFDPALDVLHFDGAIDPGDLSVDYFSTRISFFHGGKEVDLLVTPGALGAGNLTFELSTGVFIIGDGTTGTANDGLADTITGSSSHDQIAGLG